jgi:hypothetical protein
METKKPIHYLKSRNSDFLASTDLEIFDLEGLSKVLTVKNVEYKENFMVNGRKKPKGLVMYFKETYAKPLIINPTNSRIINDQTGVIDASKWIGFSLEFYFNAAVEMKVSRTETIKGGIRIRKVDTNGLVAPLSDLNTRIEQCTQKAEVMSIWQKLSETEQIEYKDKIQTKYKAL